MGITALPCADLVLTVLAPRIATPADVGVPPAAVLGLSVRLIGLAMDLALGELVGVCAPAPEQPSKCEGMRGGAEAFLCTALLLGPVQRGERRKILPIAQVRYGRSAARFARRLFFA